MTLTFELTVDINTGEPKIVFVHDELDQNVSSKLITVFIKKAKERGIKLMNPTGVIGYDNKFKKISKETYEIIINPL